MPAEELDTGTSLLHEVRTSCAAVAERAEQVLIDYHRLRNYPSVLPLEKATSPPLDANCHYLGRGADTVAFFLTLDAINFGSGYFPHLRKRSGMSGYFTIASALNDHFGTEGALSAQALAQFTAGDCARIFDQDRDNESISELMGLFAAALNDLGKYVLDRAGGSFVALVESAAGSANKLVQTLTEMPYFNDVALYEGLTVHFYKRAQLTAADLALAFDGTGPGRFDDLDHLTLFADNLVPHVLRVDGILQYDEELAAQIDAETPIPSGSAEEVEIRACAVHAVECLVRELRASGRNVNAMNVDYLLWNRGQLPEYKARPRHRTRTVFY